MAATPSTMLPLGSLAPAFILLDVTTGESITLETFKKNELFLVIFMCEHCPFVKHVQSELAQLGEVYVPKSVGIIAISSNDIEKYPQDSPERLKVMASSLNFNFPVCYDETQNVAKSYRAACTPEFYLFDKKRELIYRGQLDDSRPNNGVPVTGKDLRKALDLALVGQNVPVEQKPSVGCNIKWRPGQEPEYFKH